MLAARHYTGKDYLCIGISILILLGVRLLLNKLFPDMSTRLTNAISYGVMLVCMIVMLVVIGV